MPSHTAHLTAPDVTTEHPAIADGRSRVLEDPGVCPMPLLNGVFVREEDPTPSDPSAGLCGVPGVPNHARPPTEKARERWRRYLFIARPVPTSRRGAGTGWLFWAGLCVGLGIGFIVSAMVAGWVR